MKQPMAVQVVNLMIMNKNTFINFAVAICFIYIGLLNIFFYENLVKQGIILLIAATGPLTLFLHERNVYSKLIRNIILILCVLLILLISTFY